MPVSQEAASSFDRKAQALVDAASEARKSGRPQPFEVTFSEAELTSKVAELARSVPDFPYANTQVHLVANDLVITSTASIAGMAVSIGVVATPTVVGGKVQVAVKQVDTGALPIGGVLRPQIEAQLQQTLDQARGALPVELNSLQIADGKIVMNGRIGATK